jgi:hypothetical protein
MNQLRSRLIHFKATPIMVIALGLALDLHSAQTSLGTLGKPSGSAAAGTKSAVSEAPLPKSVFVLPRSKQEGVDPFFPKSGRPYQIYQVIPKPTEQPVIVTAELRLNGISGTAERRLAIINNRTFEVGEEGEVISGSERVRIRVLEIKGDLVVAQFVNGGIRRELHLRKGL